MTWENGPSAPHQQAATEPADPEATADPAADPAVDALLRRAAQVQSLPVGEQQGHYGQLLEELTAELHAGPAAAGQGQP